LCKTEPELIDEEKLSNSEKLHFVQSKMEEWKNSCHFDVQKKNCCEKKKDSQPIYHFNVETFI